MRTRAIVVALLLAAPALAEAQAKATSRSPVVKRKGTAQEIATARDAAIAALSSRWEGGYQRAGAGAHSCELVLLSRKTVGDLITEDVQTIDVGRLGTDMERVRDPLAGTDDLRIGTTSGAAEVTRKRERTIEGAPQKPTSDKVLFLALLSARGSGRNDDAAAAVIAWSIPCERA